MSTKRLSISQNPENGIDDSKKQKRESILDHFRTTEPNSIMDQNERFELLMSRSEKMLSEWEQFQGKINQRFQQIEEKQTELKTSSKLGYERSYQNEQYQRNYNVRIYGVPDEENETSEKCEEKLLNIFKDKLKVNIQSADIDIAHRLPKYPNGNGSSETDDTPRTIICRFVRKKSKALIIKNRNKLKKKAGDTECIVIKEDLTKYHQQLLSKCIDRFETAWAREGRIFVKETADSRPREIKTMAELGTSWLMSDTYKPTRKQSTGSKDTSNNKANSQHSRGGQSRRGRGRGGGRGVWRGNDGSSPVGRSPGGSQSASSQEHDDEMDTENEDV